MASTPLMANDDSRRRARVGSRRRPADEPTGVAASRAGRHFHRGLSTVNTRARPNTVIAGARVRARDASNRRSTTRRRPNIFNTFEPFSLYSPLIRPYISNHFPLNLLSFFFFFLFHREQFFSGTRITIVVACERVRILHTPSDTTRHVTSLHAHLEKRTATNTKNSFFTVTQPTRVPSVQGQYVCVRFF